MQPVPSYENQSMFITRRCIDGRYYMIPNRETAQLLEYLLALYAPIYEIELLLCVIMSNHLHLHIRDRKGRHSVFLSTVFGTFVKILNISIGREGTMIQPDGNKPVMLDACAEADALLYSAMNPAIDITPDTQSWTGTLFTPAQAGLRKAVKRPALLDRSRRFPPMVQYTVGLPRFQDGDTPRKVRDRFIRTLRRAEHKQQQANETAGKCYVGVRKALRTPRTATPKNPLSKPSARKPAKLYFGSPNLKAAAAQRLREFRRRYRECLEALRDGITDIVWPAGTNYHHFINGFPRERFALRPPPP